jgi:3-oxoacyl-[acyl-carrier protein] reductase
MEQATAIITGAGRGIGRAAAVELSGLGYRLLLVSRTGRELEETAGLCGGRAEGMAADVSKPEIVEQVVKRAVDRWGRVDAMVHCAGVALLRGAGEISPEEWRETVDTNLSAVVYFSRLLWPIWKKQGGGVMVNVSSVAARDPFAGLGAYGAAKAGVNLLGLALAREGQGHGIRVHTIAPGATETKMLRSLFPKENLGEDQAMDPGEVARVIVQCIRGDLAHTSGEVIYMHK